MGDKTEKEMTYEAKSLLLAPNYVKDVQVKFGEKYKSHKYTAAAPGASEFDGNRRKLTIEIMVDPDEADRLRSMPGMDDQQFVAFLMPCIETSIYKTIQQGMGKRQQKNQVEIEEAAEAPMMDEEMLEKSYQDEWVRRRNGKA